MPRREDQVNRWRSAISALVDPLLAVVTSRIEAVLQLPLMIDSSGYIAAASDFTQPVGPSFWERG